MTLLLLHCELPERIVWRKATSTFTLRNLEVRVQGYLKKADLRSFDSHEGVSFLDYASRVRKEQVQGQTREHTRGS